MINDIQSVKSISIKCTKSQWTEFGVESDIPTSGHLKDIFQACQVSRFCPFLAIMQCIRVVLSSLFECMATILKWNYLDREIET